MVSAFNEVASSVKDRAIDSRTEVFDELEADTLLENSSLVLKRAILQGGAKNAVTTGFLKRYQEIIGAKTLNPGERKRVAAKLSREIDDYAADFAEYQRVAHDIESHAKLVGGTLEGLGKERFNDIAPLVGELMKAEEISKRLSAELAHTGHLSPAMLKEAALAKAALGGISAASLSNFMTPAEATTRAIGIEQRAIANPESDAGRFSEALGLMLRSRAMALFSRQATAGMDFRKLGEKEDLTDEEAIALYLYTDVDYDAMNNLLITGGGSLDDKQRSSLKTKIEFTQRGLAKLPPYPAALYPVIRWENDSDYWRGFYQVGKVFHNMQFWSTGATAGAQIKSPTPLQLIFRVYGLSGKDIAMISSKQGEGANKDDSRPEAYLKDLGQGEVLFAPGTPFKVVSISEEPQPDGVKTKVYITVMEQPR